MMKDYKTKNVDFLYVPLGLFTPLVKELAKAASVEAKLMAGNSTDII